MTEDKIKKIILHGCNGDVEIFSKAKNNELGQAFNEVKIKNQWSYMVELMIITAKSLVPDIKSIGNSIDYKRFAYELDLWNYYKHGENLSLLNAIKAPEAFIYWNEGDDSVFSRLVPIVASNTDWEYIKEEVIKNAIYTTGDIGTFLESIVLSKLVYLVIKDRELIEIDDIITDLKNEIIYLSQKDIFESHKDCFRVSIEDCPYNYIITFERLRLEILNVLNGISSNNDKFIVLKTTLKFLQNKEIDEIEETRSFLVAGIVGIYKNGLEQIQVKDREFLEGMCSYLYKLRKSRINPENLIISSYQLPDVFGFKENEEFFHTLLNRSIVIRKEESKDKIISYIRTKSGIYRFIKIKNPH